MYLDTTKVLGRLHKSFNSGERNGAEETEEEGDSPTGS
jgi:hypothetical protein